MFSGIVEDIGKVVRVIRTRGVRRLDILTKEAYKDTAIGDSVAINGVCLTVVGNAKKALSFDVLKATQDFSGLSAIKAGDEVNVERSLKAGDRIGGHMVTGHIDCVGRIRKIVRSGLSVTALIDIAPRNTAPLVQKGSVAIDGISLTVDNVSNQTFTVHIIPHTLAVTTLGKKRVKDTVNVEFDQIGKYAQKKDGAKTANGVSLEFLRQKGYI